jgi:hypothetical protein
MTLNDNDNENEFSREQKWMKIKLERLGRFNFAIFEWPN